MSSPMDFDDEPPENFKPRALGGSGGPGPLLWACAVACIAGSYFAGRSTSDFISHLDRQVHSIHCSFLPGAAPQIGESGCRTVMMSPYSSLLRTEMWGGMPISLLALAVFAYLAVQALKLALGSPTKQKSLFLLAGTFLPALMSIIYGTISVRELGAVCKLCVGVYISSGSALVFAAAAYFKSEDDGNMQLPVGDYVKNFLGGCVYVAVLAGLYIAFAPQQTKSLEGCGQLVTTKDKHRILVPYGPQKGTPSIAVLDPLCPACRAFDGRLEASGLADKLSLQLALFPLDAKCNWMVDTSIHPGACAISEAILCEKSQAKEIIDWAFKNQEQLLETAKNDEKALRKEIVRRFPDVRGCLGRPKIKTKLNKSLRWAVANAIPVLTPQLFIGKKRICDEDTDLGLEYTISQMLKKQGGR